MHLTRTTVVQLCLCSTEILWVIWPQLLFSTSAGISCCVCALPSSSKLCWNESNEIKKVELQGGKKNRYPSSFLLPPQVVSLADYDHVQEVTKEGSKKMPSPGYPLVCVTPCDPHYPKYTVMKERCEEAGINQTQVHFSWEVAAPTDTSGARSPFETVTDTTPYTSVNHMVSWKWMDGAEVIGAKTSPKMV